jgi:hypothetical protein
MLESDRDQLRAVYAQDFGPLAMEGSGLFHGNHHWKCGWIFLNLTIETRDYRCPFPIGWLINREVCLPL